MPPPAPSASRRFETARSTIIIDRFMTHFIKIGGVGLIAAVFAIFVFIFWQILPLFQDAKVTESRVVQLENGDYAALGIDEWSELPFVLDRKGGITFVRSEASGPVLEPAQPPFSETKAFSAFRYKSAKQKIVYGTEDGYFSVVDVNYAPSYQDGKRRISYDLKASPFFEAGPVGARVKAIDMGHSESGQLAAAILEGADGTVSVWTAELTQERTLFGAGELTVGQKTDLTPFLRSAPRDVLVNDTTDGVLVLGDGGLVHYFFKTGDVFELRQTFKPFEDRPDAGIASAAFLFGDVSVVFVSRDGSNRVLSLYSAKEEDVRLFHPTKQFKPLAGEPSFYAPSSRNKAFLVGSGSQVSLRYVTTERIRWEKDLGYPVVSGVIGGKYDSLVFLDAGSKLHYYRLQDPHPEAGFTAFFGKVWYEGSPEPKYEWQSTGGSDEFEPKLSLIPLIIGSLKGTFYAMLFAIPIAILAALYTSQFLSAKVRAVAKPTMEIMASLPSVVLGFLAALWLAPLIETKVPSILLMVIFLPLSAVAAGQLFSGLPHPYKHIVKPGMEFVFLLPLFFAVVWACWAGGPLLEKAVFVAQDPSSGARVTDFRLWWPQVTGTPFDQRNSLVVGFIMGFAVIPLIFTITEDALSNVPSYLRAGSLALGASRWQTAVNVVLPTASAGIFSAIMIGLGRAIGETMIVVMATGNTPIMDFNIFSGMRTLSANIAVELPEAPHHGTLYRTLFLGAMVLFLTTFTINTIAEILRQRLREKYKTV